MSPTLRVGDTVIVDPDRSPRIGDIAVFDRPAGPVVHRVVRPGREMGDATSAARSFAPDDVLGVGVAVVRGDDVTTLRSLRGRLQGFARAASGLVRLAQRRVRSGPAHHAIQPPITPPRGDLT